VAQVAAIQAAQIGRRVDAIQKFSAHAAFNDLEKR
jgi:hypothetical protein